MWHSLAAVGRPGIFKFALWLDQAAIWQLDLNVWVGGRGIDNNGCIGHDIMTGTARIRYKFIRQGGDRINYRINWSFRDIN
eukprot:scaffold327915_cov59-Attheya_sp.AAC.2